jgi:hypothetical protein
MLVETQSYRLTLRGKPVGTHVLKNQAKGNVSFLEGKMLLQGSLGSGTILQMSQSRRHDFASRSFREVNEAASETRVFELEFSEQQGLVIATRGRERAEVPYFLPFRDPLSMLHEIRFLSSDQELVRIPMLGKDVQARLVDVVELETVFGPRQARAYLLHPGRSYVYVDTKPPHVILRLTQRLDEHLVDATLVRTAQEAEMTAWSVAPEKRGKRRRRSRRRGRGRN